MRYAVSEVINRRMRELDLKYPKVGPEKKKDLLAARLILMGGKE